MNTLDATDVKNGDNGANGADDDNEKRCNVSELELQALADGELAPARASELETHAQSCSRCARFLEEERALAARVAALPRTIVPAPEVWRAIEARIGEARPEVRSGARDASRPVLIAEVRRVPWHEARSTRVALGFTLAAAAAFAVVVSRARVDPNVPLATSVVPSASSASSFPPPAPESTARQATPEEEPYLTALAALETDFVRCKNVLPPAAVRTVEDNLRVLDSAIDTMRGALLAHPDNFDLKSQLADIYQQKIHVETDVIDLAARI